MDRNIPRGILLHFLSVALRKESVDRNTVVPVFAITDLTSLSARRAWIEIFATGLSIKSISVALRKESVDRNR